MRVDKAFSHEAWELGSQASLKLASEGYGGQLCGINPTPNRHPLTAASFLEGDHLAGNDNAFALRAMPNSDL